MNRRVSKRLHRQTMFLIKDITKDRKKAYDQIFDTLKEEYKNRNKPKQKSIAKVIRLRDKRKQRRKNRRDLMYANGMKRKNGSNWRWFKYNELEKRLVQSDIK